MGVPRTVVWLGIVADADGPPARQWWPRSKREPHGGMTKTVLIVDDDLDLQDTLRRTLAPLGVLTVEARDGMDAVVYSKQYPPHLVLLDLTMPRLDGWAVLHVLQDHLPTRHVPIVLLTGNATVDEHVARRAGAVALVRKPFSPQSLRAQVKALLDEEA